MCQLRLRHKKRGSLWGPNLDLNGGDVSWRSPVKGEGFPQNCFPHTSREFKKVVLVVVGTVTKSKRQAKRHAGSHCESLKAIKCVLKCC